MGAVELLRDLGAVGISVAVRGDKLMVRPASRLTDPYRAALRAIKVDVIALLKTSDIWDDAEVEAYEERAGIMEFDGGLTRAEAEAAAREMVRAIAAARRRG